MRFGQLSLAIGPWLNKALASGSTLLNGLVSYWPLDEISGVRYDSVGDNDLTDNNTVGAVLRGPAGTVADFENDNTESFSVSAALTNTIFTFSLWLNPESWDNYGYLLFSTNNGSYSGSDFLCQTLLGPQIQFYDVTNGVIGNVDVPSSGWFHLSVEEDRTAKTLKVYINNALKGDFTFGSVPAATPTTFTFGFRGITYGYDGLMGRIGLWHRALTSDERASLFNRGNGKTYEDLTAAEKTGLVSYWKLDETSGVRYDSHGSNDLTDNNTVGSVINASDAMDGGAASFVAANSESLSTGQVIDPSGDFTVAVWGKAATQTDNHLFNGGGGAVGIGMFIASNGNLYGWRGGGAPSITIGDVTGKWCLYLYEYVKVTHTVRVMAIGSPSNSGVWSSGDTALEPADSLNFDLGRTPVYGRYWDGQLDEVAVWSRVLTDDEIAELYAAGAGKFYPFT